ncbi:MAG: cytochrome c3 family protein [Desulfobacula sp.]|nr:cytochrome c3 family protein [Desulfobacula sp.]
MKTIKQIGLVFICVIFASGLYAFSDNIELGGEDTRGSVMFPHEFHMGEFDCMECHHDMQDGENVLDEYDLEEDNPNILCGACHNPKEKIERMEAFHYQCVGCHNEYKMTLDPTGPTMCGECHLLKK